MIVYTADITPLDDDALFRALYATMSDERKCKTDKMRHRKGKSLSVGVEYLLQCACRDFGVDYRGLHFVEDQYGKPRFSDSPLCFNLSHSGNKVMCAMASQEVGCDVEKMRPMKMDLAKRYFSVEEYETLVGCATQEERQDLFFRYWTLKESFMKCTGQGFHLPLSAFSISFEGQQPIVSHNVDENIYRLFEFNVDDGYKYAACLRGELCDVEEVKFEQVGF